MTLQTVRRLAARLLNVGESRVRILDPKKADEALTADDVRGLISSGAVQKRPEKGVGRGKARRRAVRKKLGRGVKRGSQRGSARAGVTGKDRWMAKVRAQRAYLAKVKPRLKEGEYKTVYQLIKGNAFRDKRSLEAHLQTKKLYA